MDGEIRLFPRPDKALTEAEELHWRRREEAIRAAEVLLWSRVITSSVVFTWVLAVTSLVLAYALNGLLPVVLCGICFVFCVALAALSYYACARLTHLRGEASGRFLANQRQLDHRNYGFLVVDTEGEGTALAFASMVMPEIVAASRRGTPAGAWGQRYACCAFALETLHQFHATSGGSEAAWLGAMADRRSVETVTMIVTDASVGLARVLLSVPMSKGGSA